MATSQAVNVATSSFEQGSAIGSYFTLPTTLESGAYEVRFNYYLSTPRMMKPIDCEVGHLNVIGHLAKFNAPFTIDDAAVAIDYLLNGSHPNIVIDDIAELIDALLNNN